jgi:hypothetical protein
VSLTVTVKEQLAESPAESVTVQLTVVVPLGKVEPDAGVQTTVGLGQLSFVVGVKLTTAEHRLLSLP